MQAEQVAIKQDETMRLDKGELSQMFARNAEPDEAQAQAHLHEKTQEFKIKQHNVTVDGKAAEYNVIDSNAHNETGLGEDTKEAREKKQRERDMYHRILDDLMRDLDDKIAQANEALSAIDEAEELYNSGDLDLEDPKHQRILRNAGISREDIEEKGAKAFEERRDEVKEDIGELEKDRQEVKDLRDRYEKDPDNPQIHREIKEKEETYEGQMENDLAAIENNSVESIAIIDKQMGLTEQERNEYSSKVSGDVSSFDLDDEFSDAPIATSYAKETHGQAIEAVDASAAFNKVADNSATQEREPENIRENTINIKGLTLEV